MKPAHFLLIIGFMIGNIEAASELTPLKFEKFEETYPNGSLEYEWFFNGGRLDGVAVQRGLGGKALKRAKFRLGLCLQGDCGVLDSSFTVQAIGK